MTKLPRKYASETLFPTATAKFLSYNKSAITTTSAEGNEILISFTSKNCVFNVLSDIGIDCNVFALFSSASENKL